MFSETVWGSFAHMKLTSVTVCLTIWSRSALLSDWRLVIYFTCVSNLSFLIWIHFPAWSWWVAALASKVLEIWLYLIFLCIVSLYRLLSFFLALISWLFYHMSSSTTIIDDIEIIVWYLAGPFFVSLGFTGIRFFTSLTTFRNLRIFISRLSFLLSLLPIRQLHYTLGNIDSVDVSAWSSSRMMIGHSRIFPNETLCNRWRMCLLLSIPNVVTGRIDDEKQGHGHDVGGTLVNFTSEITQSFGRILLDKIWETDDWSTISLQWKVINEMEPVNLMEDLMNVTLGTMTEVRVQGTLDGIKLTLSSYSTALTTV